MNSRYLLPCECGRSVAIELGQAGQNVSCSCGRSLAVPTMRHIRQLPEETGTPPKSPAKSTWNPVKGLTFAAGMVLIIVGLTLAIYTYPAQSQWASMKPSEEHFQEALKTIDQTSPEDLLNLWNDVVIHGIGEHEMSPFVYARKESRRLGVIVISGLVIAGCGAVLAGVSLILPGNRERAK